MSLLRINILRPPPPPIPRSRASSSGFGLLGGSSALGCFSAVVLVVGLRRKFRVKGFWLLQV